jgi:hypothetical protein
MMIKPQAATFYEGNVDYPADPWDEYIEFRLPDPVPEAAPHKQNHQNQNALEVSLVLSYHDIFPLSKSANVAII